MIAGVRGRLVTEAFARTQLPNLPGAVVPPDTVVHALDLWSARCDALLGPASSIRAISDVALVALLRILGYGIERRVDQGARTFLDAVASSSTAVPVVVVPWSQPLDAVWRDVVLDGIRRDAGWCMCCNGVALRIVDAHRTWSRRYLEFDLALLSSDADARALFWSLARAESMDADPPLLDRAVELSARHGVAVCKALGGGVLQSLSLLFRALAASSSKRPPQLLFEQSLTVVYRMLFLLFAEARTLVPMWHAVYRERYTIDAIVSAVMEGRRYRGTWDTVQAISRLAHAGCLAGELKVTPFNGRLFSPAHSTAFDQTRIGDDVMSEAVLGIATTSTGGGGRTRIRYGDLDVEQLGAVYERVLEYEPGPGGGAEFRRTRDTRQSSGTFYTPRPVTAFLVRQTLAPLVRGRTAEDILRLRVLDPAMGSGAFLVGACRYLAAAAEQSLVREGRWHHGDVTPDERASLRREIAQRCLFGVDLNPMAVQLARLSLWLATLASDKPLTFLDHHLVSGDSLLGARLEDVLRQPTRGRPRQQRRQTPLPLFTNADIMPVLEHAVLTRLRLAHQADDSAAIVADKERTLAALLAAGSPLRRWSSVLDLWCAGWFWEQGAPPAAGTFGDLCNGLLHGRSALPEHIARRPLDHAAALAVRHRFLHWPLVFPEVFCDERGEPLAAPGFDAIIGNPPWDMVRGDSGDPDVRSGRRTAARRLTAFAREAGVYRVESRSHVNRYQLFVERALQLTRPDGRIGLVLPSGAVTDTGAAPLRRHLFDQAAIDSITGLDNRGGVFPIHRSLRFALLTCTRGRPTEAVACRFGVSRMEDLDATDHGPLSITRTLLARLSGGDDLGIPEIAGERDLRIIEGIAARVPWLGAADGWHVQFGRELNATDDRDLFAPFGGSPDARPVLEGKHLEPFRTALDGCTHELPSGTTTRPVPRRRRLAYRDVASATNRLTLIASLIPARAVTTHTLFCLKSPLPLNAQYVLCALLNSFVANYLVRLRVNTHVTATLVAHLPAPLVGPRDPAFTKLLTLARLLTAGAAPVETMPEYARLQALVAHLYGVSAADFEHILGTFPLVAGSAKESALREFRLTQP